MHNFNSTHKFSLNGMIFSFTFCIFGRKFSGGFRPGPEGHNTSVLLQSLPLSSMATHDFLARIAQIFDFLGFLNFSKVGKFAASIERLKTKNALATRGFASWPPDQGDPARGYRSCHGAVPPRCCGLEPPLRKSSDEEKIFPTNFRRLKIDSRGHDDPAMTPLTTTWWITASPFL